MNCYYHEGKEAVGGCVGCGHLVCSDCKAMIGEKSYCKACVERLVTRMRLTETPVLERQSMEAGVPGDSVSLFPPVRRPRRRAGRTRTMTGILVAITVALIIGFVPLVDGQHQEALAYESQYYVQRAHRPTLSPSQIMSAFAFAQDPEDIKEGLRWAYPPGGTAPQHYPVAHVSVRNNDTVQGTFKVKIVFDSETVRYIETSTLTLRPGEVGQVEKSASIHYDRDKWSWWYEITPGTKTVTRKTPLLEYMVSRFQG